MNTHIEIQPNDSNRYREGVIRHAKSIAPTHFLTLNTHRDISINAAMHCLNQWRIEILRKLFGRKFYKKPEHELVTFIGCPEQGISGHPHFHLVVPVPKDRDFDFEQITKNRWRVIVPSGTVDLQKIGDDSDDLDRVTSYVTKHMRSGTEVSFIDSRAMDR